MRNEAKIRRIRDGTWITKSEKSHFGYKLNCIRDRDYKLIRRFETMTLSFKDSQIDLFEQKEVVFRDKGYFGAKPKGFDATIKRAVKHLIGMSDFFKKQAN